jgi:hypothetical protein
VSDSSIETPTPVSRAVNRPLPAGLIDICVVGVAAAGIWLFWSQYSNLSTLSWWYDRTQLLRTSTTLPAPDFDLTTLPWKPVHPRVFEMKQGHLTMVTDSEPFGYQAYAILSTGGANAADIQFDAEVEVGAATIGLVQSGKWIATNSSQRTGAFSDSNSALLGFGRSVTVVIANDNPAGESRLTVKSLRLYLRK